MNDQCKTKLLFLHVPKCGGTSLREYLFEKLGGGWVGRSFDDVEQCDPAELENHPLVAGHFYHFQLLSKFPDRQRITVLRDPLDRLISSFHFASKVVASTPQSATCVQQAASQMSFDEYFHSDVSMSDRHMALYIFGLRSGDDPNTIPMARLFAQACDALLQYRVGLTQDLGGFAQKLLSMRETGQENVSMAHANVSNISVSTTKGQLGALEQIRKVLKYDYLFYQYARAIAQDSE